MIKKLKKLGSDPSFISAFELFTQRHVSRHPLLGEDLDVI
jgi:hypothetical protein